MLGRLSRTQQTKKKINEAENYISVLKEKLAVTDELLRTDYEEFTKKRSEDLKDGIINWIQMMIECEQKTLDYWESLSYEMKHAN